MWRRQWETGDGNPLTHGGRDDRGDGKPQFSGGGNEQGAAVSAKALILASPTGVAMALATGHVFESWHHLGQVVSVADLSIVISGANMCPEPSTPANTRQGFNLATFNSRAGKRRAKYPSAWSCMCSGLRRSRVQRQTGIIDGKYQIRTKAAPITAQRGKEHGGVCVLPHGKALTDHARQPPYLLPSPREPSPSTSST